MARPELKSSQLTASDALRAWLDHLAHERRLSPRTLEAYGHIGRLYVAFLERHRGETLSLKDMGTITAAEVRAHMAERRSGDHPLAARSLSQSLSALDLLVNQGQTAVVFIKIALLGMPALINMVLPIAVL